MGGHDDKRQLTERMTVLVPRLQRKRRDSILRTSGRRMPLRRATSEIRPQREIDTEYDAVIVDPPEFEAPATLDLALGTLPDAATPEPIEVDPPTAPVTASEPIFPTVLAAAVALAALALATWQIWRLL